MEIKPGKWSVSTVVGGCGKTFSYFVLHSGGENTNFVPLIWRRVVKYCNLRCAVALSRDPPMFPSSRDARKNVSLIFSDLSRVSTFEDRSGCEKLIVTITTLLAEAKS